MIADNLLTHLRDFANDIFRYIFMYENFCILVQHLLKFVLKGRIDNNPA